MASVTFVQAQIIANSFHMATPPQHQQTLSYGNNNKSTITLKPEQVRVVNNNVTVIKQSNGVCVINDPQIEEQIDLSTSLSFQNHHDNTLSTINNEQLSRTACGAILSMYQGRPGPLAFMGKSEPALDLEEYIIRLLRYLEQWSLPIHGPNAGTGARCLAMSIELLHRLFDNGFGICKKSAHRLILVAILVSAKSTEDFVIPNRYWSKVGGIPLEELNELELAFCKFLSWNLTVSPEDTQVYKEKLEGPCF
jgi:hypothetical protein